jgi:uncharacterized protein
LASQTAFLCSQGWWLMKFNLLDILLPREMKFYDYFSQQANLLLEGGRTFKNLIMNIETISDTELKTALRVINEFEQRGDTVETKIIDELHKTFITPIDREDIHTIAISIDRALDILNSISRKIEIYSIRKVPVNVCKFAEIMVTISESMQMLVDDLRHRKKVEKITERMHTLENDADDLFHLSMAELFQGAYSPVEIIKYKELYEHLESAIDSVDYIGKLIRGISVKLG